MSTFAVGVFTVDSVQDHPRADRLSVTRVRGYESVTAKNPDGSHGFEPGRRVVYVPTGAVLPEDLLKEHGLWNRELGIGKLSGTKGNRVSAIELRGHLSQGLVWDLPDWAGDARVGDDLSTRLGITKYVPEIPPELTGSVRVLTEAKMSFDVEHLLAYPRLLDHDEVVVTEKLHGVCAQVSVIPGLSDPEMFGGGRVALTSKGLAEQGMVFADVPENADSPYVTASREADVFDRLVRWADARGAGRKVTLVAEVLGRGVQDLGYAATVPVLRVIDLRVGHEWLADDDKAAAFAAMGLTRVPVLYRGPFDPAVVDGSRQGMSTLDPVGTIREGVVVTAAGSQEKRLTDLGTFVRPCLKHHSPAYLRRKGGTEHS